MAAPVTIFDGHNDVLLRLQMRGGSFFERAEGAQLDMPRAREGHFGGGFFAVFVPSKSKMPTTPAADGDQGDQTSGAALAAFASLDTMPPTPDLATSQRAAIAEMALLFRLEAESGGQLAVVRTTAELGRCLETGVLAAILHFEGAEAIDPELDALEVFYQAGLRSLGPVWSRPNAFAHGVPFAFPSRPTPDPA